MNTTKNRIDEIRNNSYELDFGETFNYTFEIYKKIAVNAGLLFILLAIVGVGIVLGAIGAIIGFATLTEHMTGFDPATISPLYVVLYVLAVTVLSALFSPIIAGVIKMARQADINEPFSIGTAFDYYNGSYFKELFGAAFLLAIFSVGISTLLEVLSIPFLGAVVSVVISFLTLMTIPLIIFGDLKAIDAIKGSVTIVMANPLLILGLLVVTFLASLVGFIAFCIGYFFTAPILYALYYTLYMKSVGMDQKSEIDQIGFRPNEF